MAMAIMKALSSSAVVLTLVKLGINAMNKYLGLAPTFSLMPWTYLSAQMSSFPRSGSFVFNSTLQGFMDTFVKTTSTCFQNVSPNTIANSFSISFCDLSILGLFPSKTITKRFMCEKSLFSFVMRAVVSVSSDSFEASSNPTVSMMVIGLV